MEKNNEIFFTNLTFKKELLIVSEIITNMINHKKKEKNNR